MYIINQFRIRIDRCPVPSDEVSSRQRPRRVHRMGNAGTSAARVTRLRIGAAGVHARAGGVARQVVAWSGAL